MSYSKIAIVISIVCIIYCILYESILLKYEAVNDFVYALGVVSNCVALSIIASCIFYFITDYLPKKHQQTQTRNYIIKNIELLEEIGKNAFIDIVNISNPTKQEFINCCDFDLMKKNGRSSQNDLLFTKIDNWFDYFDCIWKTEACIIQRLMIFESMIPIEIRLIFIELQKENTIFSDSKTYRGFYNSDNTKRSIKIYANDIYSHISSLVELKITYNKTLKI